MNTGTGNTPPVVLTTTVPPVETTPVVADATPVSDATPVLDAGKMFTQGELDEIISKRLAKEKVKSDRERIEVERLAKLSEQEKTQEELKRYKQRDLEHSVLLELSSNNISVDFVDFLKADTLENSVSNITAFKAVQDKWIATREADFETRVEEEVIKRIAGKTPVKPDSKPREVKHDFSKMKLSEINKVLNK